VGYLHHIPPMIESILIHNCRTYSGLREAFHSLSLTVLERVGGDKTESRSFDR